MPKGFSFADLTGRKPKADPATAAETPAAEDDEEDEEKAAEATAADDDDDDEEDEDEPPMAAATRAGRRAERQRIGAILRHAAAVGREGLAMHLAFETGMAAKDAIAALKAAPEAADRPATGALGLDQAMAAAGIPDVESAPPPGADASVPPHVAALRAGFKREFGDAYPG